MRATPDDARLGILETLDKNRDLAIEDVCLDFDGNAGVHVNWSAFIHRRTGEDAYYYMLWCGGEGRASATERGRKSCGVAKARRIPQTSGGIRMASCAACSET